MPKELVYGQEPEGSSTPESHVRVGWSDSHMQIATINPHDSLRPLAEHGAESNGWFISLDRHGINDLIRVLRRARDKAFGPDE